MAIASLQVGREALEKALTSEASGRWRKFAEADLALMDEVPARAVSTE